MCRLSTFMGAGPDWLPTLSSIYQLSERFALVIFHFEIWRILDEYFSSFLRMNKEKILKTNYATCIPIGTSVSS